MKETPIRENHLYAKAYAAGKKYVGRYCVVYVLPDRQARRLAKSHPQKEKVNRIGLTVTKKIGGAVVRNRVKRIIRAAFRGIASKQAISTGYLIVIVARPAAVSVKSTEIEKDLSAGLAKLGLCK
ncbi:MAG: ribonuclease P protein component [Clostridiales bacterium]|nr:ribonuclease P protein component [Clostridiales bacterium]